MSGKPKVFVGEFVADVTHVEIAGAFAADSEDNKDDVAGLWPLWVNSRSMLWLPNVSREDGLLKVVGGVE